MFVLRRVMGRESKRYAATIRRSQKKDRAGGWEGRGGGQVGVGVVGRSEGGWVVGRGGR